MSTMALALVPTGTFAVWGRGISFVSVDSATPQVVTPIEHALTTGQPASVKPRKNVVLSSAQERCT